jgi:hypothetical protein
MIYDLNSGAPEFDGAHYEPAGDPFFYRQIDPTCYKGFSEEPEKKANKKYSGGGILMFGELKDAYIGIVEHPHNPPVACYSIAGTRIVLKEKHGLDEKEIEMAIAQLQSCDLGPATPCFLDSTPLG